jgi:hypothetical protein
LGLKDLCGQDVVLSGRAKNAKGNAVLYTEDRNVVYIKDMSEWSEELLDAKITIKGQLKEMKLIPDPKIEKSGAISQGAKGNQIVLENIEIIED